MRGIISTTLLAGSCLLLLGCSGGASLYDFDGDGSPDTEDCAPEDASIHPNADDPYGNGVDEDCDGVDGQDADGDGFAAQGDDCDDLDATINPDAVEDCDNGGDEDCDNLIDLADPDCNDGDDDDSGDDDDITGDDDDDSGDDDDITGDDDDTTVPLSVGCGGDHLTLQSAVDAASNGDTITMCSGTYSGGTVIDGKQLSIVGAGQTQTSLTAPNGTILFRATNSADVTVSDLNYSGAVCSGTGFCGVYASSSTLSLTRVTITNIQGHIAAGLKGVFSAVSVDDVIVNLVDSTGGSGGGVTMMWSTFVGTNLTVSSCTSGDDGGGLYGEDSTIACTGCSFQNNAATTGMGGGLFVRGDSTTLTGGSVGSNTANDGGGITVQDSGTVLLDGTTLTGNSATGSTAGGVQIRPNGGAPDTSSVELDNVFVGTGGSENTPADVKVEVYTSADQSYDWTGSVSYTCSLTAGACY